MTARKKERIKAWYCVDSKCGWKSCRPKTLWTTTTAKPFLFYPDHYEDWGERWQTRWRPASSCRRRKQKMSTEEMNSTILFASCSFYSTATTNTIITTTESMKAETSKPNFWRVKRERFLSVVCNHDLGRGCYKQPVVIKTQQHEQVSMCWYIYACTLQTMLGNQRRRETVKREKEGQLVSSSSLLSRQRATISNARYQIESPFPYLRQLRLLSCCLRSSLGKPPSRGSGKKMCERYWLDNR